MKTPENVQVITRTYGSEEDAINVSFYKIGEHYYQFSGNENTKRITPVNMNGASTVPWMEVPIPVKEFYYIVTHPKKRSAEEKNRFVYGEEEGNRKNEFNEWISQNYFYSPTITRQVIEELGHRYEKVESMCYYYGPTIDGTGCTTVSEYLLDDKWLISVYTGNQNCEDTYKIQDYDKILSNKKYFGQRAARLAQKVDVPWKIALLLGHSEKDADAICILQAIKEKRGTANEEQIIGLQGISHLRAKTLQEILGSAVWKALNLRGKAIYVLSDYIYGFGTSGYQPKDYYD